MGIREFSSWKMKYQLQILTVSASENFEFYYFKIEWVGRILIGEQRNLNSLIYLETNGFSNVFHV